MICGISRELCNKVIHVTIQYNIQQYNNIIIHVDLVVMINDIIDYGHMILEIVITLGCSLLISVIIY